MAGHRRRRTVTTTVSNSLVRWRWAGMSVIEDRLDSNLGDYYLDRIRVHMDDSYAGVLMRKFPEDLRTFEEIIWECRINVVLEIGIGLGGSALWFRDRLRTAAQYGRIAHPLVISVDIRNIGLARAQLERVDPGYAETIRLVEADVCDPGVVDQVRAHLPADARVLVVDDSGHSYATTMATLRHFSPLVPVGGYLVVEDSHRDIEGMLPPEVPGYGTDHAHGTVRAVDEWLATEAAGRFERRRDRERYIVTCHPGGWLMRVR